MSGLGLCFFTAASADDRVQLDMSFCLDSALEHNRTLVQGREKIKEEESGRVVVHSRFMPHLDLTANYDALRTDRRGVTDDEISSRLRFTQRLLEFGPDLAAEVQLRADLREAIYSYQDQIYAVFSEVWRTYHLILLQDRQLAIRQQSRQGFQEVYERKQARFERRLSDEEEVLTAYLNVLNEELAINNVERAQFNNKMTLLRLIGRPIGTQVELASSEVGFTPDPDSSVQVAMGNSVQVALAEKRLEEQQRVVSEIGWDYTPNLKVGAGVEDGRRDASVNVDKDGETWGVDVESRLRLSEKETEPGPGDETQWFARVEARIPIFEGGSRVGRERLEKARERQVQVEVADLRAATELQVRQAYQSMLEAEGRQQIQEEQVRIARRRLEINQILKDKGQADESKLEQIRTQFFAAQDILFQNQATFIDRQADLRKRMGYFE